MGKKVQDFQAFVFSLGESLSMWVEVEIEGLFLVCGSHFFAFSAEITYSKWRKHLPLTKSVNPPEGLQLILTPTLFSLARVKVFFFFFCKAVDFQKCYNLNN